jgi:hypothetical protein
MRGEIVNTLKHILQQPFVAATGLAALVHSTWALGTLFAGEQPDGWHLLGWLLPALLIAFALDVGQISTSYEIRQDGLTWTRGITFVVFAGATYYLQWLYIAHHMPALALAPGVRQTWADFATVMRDAAVWVIPALLPLSTLLYTFSGGKARAGEGGGGVINIREMSVESRAKRNEIGAERRNEIEAGSNALGAGDPNETRREGVSDVLQTRKTLDETRSDRPVETPEPPLLDFQQSEGRDGRTGQIRRLDGEYVATFGDWSKTYATEASAQRGLSGYISRYRYKQQQNGHIAQEEGLGG